MRHRRLLHSFLFVLAAFGFSACASKPLDLPKVLQVTDVSTGYFDAGIVEGYKNKIVPTISLRLKNISSEPVESVQMIAKFNVIDDPEELGSAPYVRVIGPEGLPPGQTGAPVVMKTNLGYTSEAPRANMFTHSMFKDVKVELFAKYKAQTWMKMGEYKISRQLLTR
jgi:hypothetical protein